MGITDLILVMNGLVIIGMLVYMGITDHPDFLVVWHSTAIFSVLLAAICHYGTKKKAGSERKGDWT